MCAAPSRPQSTKIFEHLSTYFLALFSPFSAYCSYPGIKKNLWALQFRRSIDHQKNSIYIVLHCVLLKVSFWFIIIINNVISFRMIYHVGWTIMKKPLKSLINGFKKNSRRWCFRFFIYRKILFWNSITFVEEFVTVVYRYTHLTHFYSFQMIYHVG